MVVLLSCGSSKSACVYISGFQNEINNFPFNFFDNTRTNTGSQILTSQVPSAGLCIGGAKIKKRHQGLYVLLFLLPAAMIGHRGARFSFLKLFQPFFLSESISDYLYYLSL